MATIKFSEFDAGNINIAGAQLVGLTGGNSATNARFTASDLVNGLATVTYVDTQDAGLQSQITQNTNDILAIANNEANITTLQGQVGVLEGKVVVLEGNIVTLENSVTVNSDDIIVIQGQIADLQANGNIQLLSLDNSSNVLSISGGNTVDFTTVLAGGGGGIESVTGGTNITTVPSGSDVTVNLDPNISVSSLSATGNIDVGNINVDDCILLGSGTGGSITGAESISAQSLLAIGNLNVAGYLVDGIIDDDTLATASATTLATSESVKAYVDAKPTSGIAIGNVTVEPTAALQSIAIGEAADASVAFAIAIGKNSSAPNNFGIAIGENTTVGVNSVALGYNADASTNYTTALGWSAQAIGSASTALGHECEATGVGSIAIGSDSTASSTAGMAIGYKSDVQAAYSTSIGWQNDISTTGSYTISIGNYVANNTYTEPDAIKIAAGSTYQTQVEVRPNYLDLSSTGFGIACNASVGFTFTDAINGNVTLSSLIGGGGGGGGGNSNIAVATASDGQDYLTTFDTSFFITADPTATDTGYIAMGEAAAVNWNSGAYELHGGGSGSGKSLFNNKTITNKISSNGPHIAMAASNDFYLGTRYAALYTDASYDVTLSSRSLGHVNLAIDNVDKLVIDGPNDKVQITTNLDVDGTGTHTFQGTLQFTQLSNFGGNVGITSILDEDDMVSDSATALATQQSIKAYVDANAGGGSAFTNIEISNGDPGEFGIEWNDGLGTKYGDIVAQPDSNEFEISSGSVLCRDLVLIGDRDVEIKTGFSGRDIIIGDLTWPASDGTVGQVLQTDGAGTLSFGTSVRLATLEISNATVTSNTTTSSMDVQFDDKPPAKITSGVMVQVHGSWDASAAGAFDWATGEIASHGISNVTRDSAGIYTVTFDTPFASDRYTATFGVGSTDYSGSGASPREVSLLSRTANNCQVICERTDDAVNEDNFYMSLMICGVI
jgi:hypothetical protein